jgi:hypothetical protein
MWLSSPRRASLINEGTLDIGLAASAIGMALSAGEAAVSIEVETPYFKDRFGAGDVTE